MSSTSQALAVGDGKGSAGQTKPAAMEDHPPNSRIFVVCGKAAELELLTGAFEHFGQIQSVKMVRDKGVAYIKFRRASAAATAIETMHEAVLNEGRGPLLKVMLAEAPNTRRGSHSRQQSDPEGLTDPDNIPARSRLFLVVPKTANGRSIEAEMEAFRDLQYCKTDLIASKGIVFCKYAKSSSALKALEEITERGTLAGYKIKCMLAEPKGKRGRAEIAWSSEPQSPAHQAARFTGGLSHRPSYAAPASPLAGPMAGYQVPYMGGHSQALPPQRPQSHGQQPAVHPAAHAAAAELPPLAPISAPPAHLPGVDAASQAAALNALANLQSIAAAQGAANLGQAPPALLPSRPMDLAALQRHQAGLGALGGLTTGMVPPGGSSLLDNLGFGNPPASAGHPGEMSDETLGSQNRLFVVVHKSVSEPTMRQLFRVFPGMEYCDLKHDHATGLSKGFGYVKFSHSASAMAALEQLNGLEFPPASSHYLKVMWAEPMTPRLPAKYSNLLASESGPPTMADSNFSEGSILQHTAETGDESVALGQHDLAAAVGLQPQMHLRGLATGMLPHDDSTSLSETLDHNVEVAAVQNSLANMSMPQPRQDSPAPESRLRSPGSEVSWDGQSRMSLENGRLYTHLTRPLPDYCLEHIFSKYGKVEYVRLMADKRFGIVKFVTPEPALQAMECLNGSEICGEVLSVLLQNPMQNLRNSKRARMGIT
ncbi:hypothetical protein WJX74_007012 [Apatococcus lobatus]|uniref:RRM domain-containing protein n=1 Tax=Apatococcus lobatus TaxID=904363 RepID=A0AAW1QWV6_9CHLO